MKKILAAVVLAFGSLLVAAPALAATPAPTPTFVEYTGTSTTSVPGHPEYTANAAADTVLPLTMRIECAGKKCTVVLFTLTDVADGDASIDMTDKQTLTLVDGHGSFAMPGFGTLCDTVSLPAGPMVIDASATGLTGTRSGPAESAECSDGSSESVAFLLTFAATVSAGDPCVLDDSCHTPAPEVSAMATHDATTLGRGSGPRAASVPSVLSALPTIATAVTARNSVWAAATAVVLVLLIAIPTHFFNEAAGKASELFEKWWRTRRPARNEKKPEGEKPVRLAGWPLAAAGVVAASIISAFVDPRFGFDAASARTFASILVSFVVDVCIGWFVLLFVVRKTHPASTARFEFKPLTLLIVAVAVLFTRLTDFQPGIVFGLVAGVAFGGLLATAEKARVALIGLGWSFGIGLVAWVGYSLTGVHAVFLHETLSGIAIAGSSSLPIALLPVRGLTGAVVWRWKRWVWALSYAIGLFAFMVMLMPMPFSWQNVPLNLIVWLALYLAYAVVAIGLWMLVARPWKKEDDSDSSERSGARSVDRSPEAPVA